MLEHAMRRPTASMCLASVPRSRRFERSRSHDRERGNGHAFGTRNDTGPPAEDTDASDRARLYEVHAVRPDEICATDVIWAA